MCSSDLTLGFVIGKHSLHGKTIRQIHLAMAVAFVISKTRKPVRLELGVIIIVVVVHTHNRVATPEQLQNQGCANKAGRAGDKDFQMSF